MPMDDKRTLSDGGAIIDQRIDTHTILSLAVSFLFPRSVFWSAHVHGRQRLPPLDLVCKL